MADVPVLSDGVVTLRAHRLSDVDDIVTQCVDPESIEWTTIPVPYDRAMAESYVTTAVPAGWRTGRELNFAIEATHPDGTRRFSGSISLRPMGDGVAEIAFGLHPAVRGKGVCSRAVTLILDWGFTQGIEVVMWYAYVGNWGSWRVAWANGFTFHGSIKKFLAQRGARRDCWYGTLRADDTREPKHRWHIPPTLESDRIRLRPQREEDGQGYWEVLHDSRSRHFGGRGGWLKEVESPAHLVRRAMEANARGERFDWTIADRDTDRFIGQIQIFRIGTPDDTHGEIGYSVHPEARGKGVLREALGMLVEWAFRSRKDGGQGLRRLSLTTAGTNKASRHGAEMAGFTLVASEPEGFPVGETEFTDSTTYHRLNPAWDPSWLD